VKLQKGNKRVLCTVLHDIYMHHRSVSLEPQLWRRKGWSCSDWSVWQSLTSALVPPGSFYRPLVSKIYCLCTHTYSCMGWLPFLLFEKQLCTNSWSCLLCERKKKTLPFQLILTLSLPKDLIAWNRLFYLTNKWKKKKSITSLYIRLSTGT